MLAKIKKLFKDYFLTGLLVLGPLVISFWVLKSIVATTDELLLVQQWIPFEIPGLGVLVAIGVILFAGFLGRNFIGRFLFLGMNDLVEHIPIVGAVYSSIKQVFETLLHTKGQSFGRVVLVEYPGPGHWTIAFVTQESIPDQLAASVTLGSPGEKWLSVYVPTTPNPTSGFYLFVEKTRVLETRLSVDSAFKMLISLGMVQKKNGN